MNLKLLSTKHHYISPPKQRQESTTNENLSFCIRLLNLDLPANLINDNSAKFFIKASLFDSNYKAFFGKQWNSSPLENINKLNDIAILECNQAIYFHTAFMDEHLTVVFEIVRFKPDGIQSSVGWTVFNILQCTKSITDLESKNKSDLISIAVYKGTARALFHLTGPLEANPKVKSYEKSFLHLNINVHKAFDICHSLVPEYFLLHEDDCVPGLEKDSEGFSDLVNPRLSKFITYSIEKVKVFIGPSVVEFEKALLEHINADRLNRDEIIQNKDVSSLTIVERRLRVGVHNGLMYTEDNDTIYLNVQDPQLRRTTTRRPCSVTKTEENNFLTAKNSIEISMPTDQEFVIVFILEYSIREKRSLEGAKELNAMSPLPQHTYQVRWIKYRPFAQGTSADAMRTGVRLDLDFSGGSVDAPENVLVYKSDASATLRSQADGDKILDQRTGSKLFAVLREKDPNEKEPITSVTNASSLINDLSMEEKITMKENYRQLAEPPKPSVRKSKVSSKVESEIKSNNESQIQDAQIRLFQQFLLQQQSQNQQSLKHMSESQSMIPSMIGIPFPNHMVNLWQTKLINEDKIVDYDSIDAYMVNEKYSPTAGGKSSRMFPLQMRSHNALGLSRAAYSKMHDAGFPELIDCNGDQPFVVDPVEDDDRLINLNLEERDHKQCNEIIFQFMALSRFELTGNNTQTKSVFFTFQFYRFPVIATDRLILDRIIDHISNYEKSAPMILRKTDESGKINNSPPGVMVKYILDPSFMKPGEMFGFLEYLSQQVLHIDVWDGDSLLLIGSCAVNLKNLCRQGKTSVQISYELDIINQIEIDEGSSVDICGRLHLRMANLGSVTTNRLNGMTVKPHHKKGMIIDATDIERSSMGSLVQSKFGGSLTDIYREEDIHGSRLGYSNLVVRPQPAVVKNRELSEMIEKRSATIRGDHSLSPVKTPLMNENTIRGINHDKSKKLERFKSALRRLQNNEPLDVTDNKLILEAKRSDKAEKQRVLQTIQCYREQQKGEIIRKLLNGVIEKETTLYPKFGCTELFEVKIKNHFNADTNVNIEISDTSGYLAPVINPNELRALKTLFSITTASENDLINFNKEKGLHQIFMKSKESVLIPFKYTNMTVLTNHTPIAPAAPGSTKPMHNLAPGDVEYQIVFRTSENKLLSILRVKVISQPPIIDQTFRLFHPEQSFLKSLVRLPPLQFVSGPNNSIQTLCRCTDPEILTDCQPVPVGTPHDVLLKIPCGPAPQARQFLMAIYVDKFLLKPIQTWHFTVHSKSRIDVVAHQGRSTNMTLLLKGTSSTHHVQVYTSHPEEISVGSVESNSFTLAAHTTYELSLSLTPLKIGNRRFQVNVVDVDNRTLVRSWMICAICKEPEISKMFEMQLPVGGGDVCRKRIGFQNPYPHRKKFYLSTDRPDLVLLKDAILAINSNEVEHIGMVFVPVIYRGKQKIYVFINDEDGMNVETFAIIVNYQ